MAPVEEDDFYERSGHERKRVRKSSEAYGTRSSSNYSTHTLQVRPDGRSGPPEHHDHSSQPASNTRTESLARSGVKRKAAAGDDVCNSKRTSVFRQQEEQR